jgi:hypothetical protein
VKNVDVYLSDVYPSQEEEVMLVNAELDAKDLTEQKLCSPALYRIGAFAALATVAITIIQIMVFFVQPPPSFQPTADAVIAIFNLLKANPVLGFIELDGLMIFDYVLLILVFLTLYALLKRTNPGLTMIGTVMALVGITIYFTVNPAPSMIVLSGHYASATAGAERAGYVYAGQGVLTSFQGAAFLVHYVLMGIAGIIVSAVMLQSHMFSKATAIAGLLQGILMLIPSTFGTIGMLFALSSLIPFSVWFLLIARRLMTMARAAG